MAGSGLNVMGQTRRTHPVTSEMKVRAREAAWAVATDPATPGKNIPLETPEDAASARACSDLMADAALSAALDPEDEVLVEAIARATSLCGRDWDTPFDFDTAPDYAKDAKRDEARAAIAALKAAALGEKP